MAYICTKGIECRMCEHYKFDKENNRYACFVMQDKEEEKKNFKIEKSSSPVKNKESVIIHCKDCKYWNGKYRFCENSMGKYLVGGLHPEDDFCSRAEKIERTVKTSIGDLPYSELREIIRIELCNRNNNGVLRKILEGKYSNEKKRN